MLAQKVSARAVLVETARVIATASRASGMGYTPMMRRGTRTHGSQSFSSSEPKCALRTKIHRNSEHRNATILANYAKCMRVEYCDYWQPYCTYVWYGCESGSEHEQTLVRRTLREGVGRRHLRQRVDVWRCGVQARRG